MKPKTKLRNLRALMKRHDVPAKDVAKILKVSEARVYGWLSKGQTAPIPEAKLRLLELELSQTKK
jgi:transposase